MRALRTHCRGILALVCLLAAAGGCSSNESSWTPGTGTAGSGGRATEPVAGAPSGTGGGTRGDCVADSACDCGNGLVGQTTCADGDQTCDCSSCPEKAPAAPAKAFTPCGGEPFGVWRVRAVDTSDVRLHVNVQGRSAEDTTCDSSMQDSKAPEMALQIDSGGLGQMLFAGLEVTGTILESCVKQDLGSACDGVEQCQPGPCGTCECKNGLEGYTGGFDWTRTDTTLTIDAGNPLDFDYCVKDSTLTLELRAKPALIFELERVMAVGTPAACADREPGQCAGAGCTWAKDTCAGTASASCTLEDYDHVTGCRFIP